MMWQAIVHETKNNGGWVEEIVVEMGNMSGAGRDDAGRGGANAREKYCG
jgi:hypothetical protein